MKELSRRRAALVSLAALFVSVIGSLLFWWTLSQPAAPPGSITARDDVAAVAPAARREQLALDAELAAFDLRPPIVKQQLSSASADEHPHPITPAHERLRLERAYVAELNQAIDFHDGLALREALDAYRRDFPEDQQRLQEAYGIIGDCLTSPGEASREAARSFYDAHHGSSLRRWVRRVCLEPQNGE
jgi:hypothetical protein